VLYHSAAPTVNTGYGRGTREIATRLNEAGHDVAVQTLGSVRNEPIWWHGEEFPGEVEKPMKLYPSNTPFGVGDAETHYEDWDADFYFTHFDTWMEPARQKIPEMEVPYSSYVIVDHYPVPDAVVSQVSNAEETIAMSKYAKEVLAEKGVRARYIPHGVNTDIYKPMDDPPEEIVTDSPDGGERRIDVEETFIVGIVAANHGDRKHIPEQMQAFKMFLDEVDEDAVLHIHTDTNAKEGFNLQEVQKEIGIPDRNISHPHQSQYHNLTDEEMAAWYNVFDVLMNCSRGESWGFAITEAQACGTPCIVTNFSSMPEQVGITPEDPGWHNWMQGEAPYGGRKLGPHGIAVNPAVGEFKEKVSAKQFHCSPHHIFNALKMYHNNPRRLENHGEKAAEYVRDNYTWKDHVAPAFIDFFNSMEARL